MRGRACWRRRATRTSASSASWASSRTWTPPRRGAWQRRSRPVRRRSGSRSTPQRSRPRSARSATCSPGLPRFNRRSSRRCVKRTRLRVTSRSSTQAARAKLTRLLFWIPAPPSTQTVERARAGARLDDLARELERGGRSLGGSDRAPALLARDLSARGRHALRLSQPAAACARLAGAGGGHLRALSLPPRGDGARDDAGARGARPDRAVDRRRRCSDLRPMPSRFRRRSPTPSRVSPRSCWPCPPSRGCSTGAAWRSATSAGTRASLGFRRARAAEVLRALRSADIHRRAERTGPRAVRQPREPGTARVQRRDDRPRRVSRAPLPTQEPADAAAPRARAAQLGGPVSYGLVRGAGCSPARGCGARRRRLPRGRRSTSSG